MIFLSETHEQAFYTFLQEAYLSLEEVRIQALGDKTQLLRNQLAFLYIVAYYQADYEAYEGDTFYVEYIETIELGGPTYLLEEHVCLREDYPHEQAVAVAKQFVREGQKEAALTNTTLEMLYQNACRIANNSPTMKQAK